MQLAQELKQLGLAAFPCAVSYDERKTKWVKRPLTVDKESWAVTGRRDINDPRVQWGGCTVLGLPVPEGVVIIDLDHYVDGCTTEAVDAILGVRLDWGAALVQTTIGGGGHYAFRAPQGWGVNQSDSIGGLKGFDTRVGSKGFICSGQGYAPCNSFGVYRLAYPDSLPPLPDECRPTLEKTVHEVPESSKELTDSADRDVPTLVEALRFVDPTTRETWRNVGFALKHYFHDDEGTGYAIWDAWSRGEFTPDGTEPEGYNAETQPSQWAGFAVQRGDQPTITAGWLFHNAMQGGWRPPARFDTSGAFGANALKADAFNDLVQRILEEGADIRAVEGLLEAIRTSGCNDMQALLLRNELKAMMRSAKLLDKATSSLIDKATNPAGTSAELPAHSGQYNKNHMENAELFLSAHYPNNTLMRAQQVWYVYDGKCWVEVDDDGIDHQLTRAMQASRPQKSTVNGTYQTLASLCYRPDARMNEDALSVVLFQNGALDLYSGQLLPHDPRYMTTKIVPYNYNPNATAPQWLSFLDDVFEGDGERVALLQEWFGYMLSPTYQYQKIMQLLGPPRCGKGTIGAVLRQLVGDQNYSGCALSSFAKDDFLDSMRNVTVAFSGDTAKTVGRHIVDVVTENLKKISGNDAVDFARKYKARMSCKLPCRITLAANHVPRLFDDSGALAGRLLVLPFEVTFENREDPGLLGKLTAELEGIAVWALRGLARLNANGRFTHATASDADVQLIDESYSPLKLFISARCRLGTDGVITAADLYDVYRAWAVNEQEERILSRKVFVSSFKDATRGRGCKYGPHRTESGVFRGFKGVTVLEEGEPRTASAFRPVVHDGGKV